MARLKWVTRLATSALVAAALAAAALPVPAAAARIPAFAPLAHGAGTLHGSGSWLLDPPALPSWPANPGGMARPAYAAVIANNCSDPTFSVCAAYGEESEYALFRFYGNHTGTGIGRISLTEPGVGKVTFYGVMHISNWELAPGNPWADFFPGTQDFYATAGTMDLTTVTPAGTTRQNGLPLGLPFIESGPGAHIQWGGQTYPDGDTGVTLKLGVSRITTLYPPLTCTSPTSCPSSLAVPADVPLYLIVARLP